MSKKYQVIWKPKQGTGGVVRFRSEVTAQSVREATEKVCITHRVAQLVSITEVDQNPLDIGAMRGLFSVLEAKAVRDGWRAND